MFSDFDFSYSARLLATETARIHQPAYLYHFDLHRPRALRDTRRLPRRRAHVPQPALLDHMAAHTSDARLSDALIGYWVRFIQTGNPNRRA